MTEAGNAAGNTYAVIDGAGKMKSEIANGYVRAQIRSGAGIAYMQPFGIRESRAE